LGIVYSACDLNAERLKAFASIFEPKHTFTSFDEMLMDQDVDAIVISLPNSLHYPCSLKALEAGKHVLCEKPVSINAAQAKAMFAAAKKAGVHMVEAYPFMAQPQTIALRQLVKEGAFGRLELIQASFGFLVPEPASNVRLVADLGGGARYDAASYPLSVIRMVAQECPIRIRAEASWYSPGVDRTMTAVMQYKSGLLAQVAASFDVAYHRHAFFGGDRGAAMTDYANHAAPGETMELKVKRTMALNTPFDTLTFPGTNGFFAEAESFAALVAGDKDGWTGATPEESIDIMRMIDAIGESLKSGDWAPVN